MKYEVWKVKKGVIIEIIREFLSYEDAWNWVQLQNDSGNYVVRYFNK